MMQRVALIAVLALVAGSCASESDTSSLKTPVVESSTSSTTAPLDTSMVEPSDSATAGSSGTPMVEPSSPSVVAVPTVDLGRTRMAFNWEGQEEGARAGKLTS